MGFSELGQWLKELAADEIDIAVSPMADGEITAIPSYKFRNWLKPYDDHSYKDKDDDGDDDDFDYESLEFRVASLMSSRRGYMGERGSMSERESTIIIDHEKQAVWCIVAD